MSVCIQRYLSYLFLFIIKSFNFSFYCYFKLLVVQSTIIVFILLLDPCCSLQIVFIQNMKWSEPLYSLNFYVFYSELLAQQLRRHSCFLKSRFIEFLSLKQLNFCILTNTIQRYFTAPFLKCTHSCPHPRFGRPSWYQHQKLTPSN